LLLSLQKLGHQVEVVGSLNAAGKHLNDSDAALLILDMALSDQSGKALSSCINELKSDRNLYLLWLTAEHDSSFANTALACGIDDILIKPSRAIDLTARLNVATRILALQSQLSDQNRDQELAYQSLQGEFDSLSSDLAVASTVQQALLPEPGRFGRLQVRGFLHSALHMAGDCYDYFPLGDKHLAFYLADVVGHGAAAALVSFALNHQINPRAKGLCQSRFDSASTVEEAVIKTVQDLNDQFSHDGEHNRWFTMIYGLIDLTSGEIVLCQAGHPPALHYRHASSTVDEIGVGGFPVGLFHDVSYTAVRCNLASGDRLLLCSDGAMECFSEDDEEFGTTQMKLALADFRDQSLENLVIGVNQRLESWRHAASFDDDVSVLIFEAAA